MDGPTSIQLPSALPAAAPLPGAPNERELQIDGAQSQLEALREELNVLRRRDETLHFYMHRLSEELRLAARLQQDFLPKSLPEVGSVRFHTLFRPAGYVSGDLYDVMRLDERRVGFYLGDAVGHGMPAALLSIFLKQALVTKEIREGSYRLLAPSESMARLNRSLLSQNLSCATFATGLCATIDVVSLTATVARAGHPHPLILRAEGAIEAIQVEGGLLGVFEDEPYGDQTVQLCPGDRLLGFTDGVEVAFGGSDVCPDIDRWFEELKSIRHLPAGQLLSRLGERIDQEKGSLDPKDDLTIIIAEVIV